MKIDIKTAVYKNRLTRLILNNKVSKSEEEVEEIDLELIDMPNIPNSFLEQAKLQGIGHIEIDPMTGGYDWTDEAKMNFAILGTIDASKPAIISQETENLSHKDVICMADIHDIDGNIFFDNINEPTKFIGGKIVTELTYLGSTTKIISSNGKSYDKNISQIEYQQGKSESSEVSVNIGSDLKIGQTLYNESEEVNTKIDKLLSSIGISVFKEMNDLIVTDKTISILKDDQYESLFWGNLHIKAHNFTFDSEDAYIDTTHLSDNVLDKVLNSITKNKIISYDELTTVVSDFAIKDLSVTNSPIIEFTKKYMSQVGDIVNIPNGDQSLREMKEIFKSIDGLIKSTGKKIKIKSAYINYRETPLLMYFLHKHGYKGTEIFLRKKGTKIVKEFIDSKLYKTFKELSISDDTSNTHDRYVIGEGKYEVKSTNQFIPLSIEIDDAKPIFNLNFQDFVKAIEEGKYKFESKDCTISVVPKGMYETLGGKK